LHNPPHIADSPYFDKPRVTAWTTAI
jgi:hypothetical protein